MDTRAENIKEIFEIYGINTTLQRKTSGSTIVQYTLLANTQEDMKRFYFVKKDLKLALASRYKYPRIYCSETDNLTIFVELPKDKISYVFFKDVLKDLKSKRGRYNLPIILGKDVENRLIVRDLTEIPNILMAGATGTGKTVFLMASLTTLALTNSEKEVQFIIMNLKLDSIWDPFYSTSYMALPMIEWVKEASKGLMWCLKEMDRRYDTLEKTPKLVLVIEDFRDLMLSDENAEDKICKLAKMGPKVGIHMILSTSCPSESVITDRLRNVIPGRIAGALATKRDSQRVLNKDGAGDLLGNGDMIYKNLNKGEEFRIQVPMISYYEIEKSIKKLKTK